MSEQVIVAGHLMVSPTVRDAYLQRGADVVRQAREADGCLDFTMSADLLDEGRINILERWTSREAVEAFRGSGPEGDQAGDILAADVREFDVAAERSLT